MVDGDRAGLQLGEGARIVGVEQLPAQSALGQVAAQLEVRNQQLCLDRSVCAALVGLIDSTETGCQDDERAVELAKGMLARDKLVVRLVVYPAMPKPSSASTADR